MKLYHEVIDGFKEKEYLDELIDDVMSEDESPYYTTPDTYIMEYGL